MKTILATSSRTGFTSRLGMLLLLGILCWLGSLAHGQKIIINEFYRTGTGMGAGGLDWIEVLITQDMTAAELNTYYVGDSNNAVSTRNGVYQFENMASIAAIFKAGTLIVVSGTGGPAADASYNPAGGDYTLVLYTNGAYIARISAGDAVIAGSDVLWVDTTSTGATLSPNGFAVAYGATGAFQANASVTLAAAPGIFRAAGQTANTSVAGAYTASNWTTNIFFLLVTPADDNSTNNGTLITNMHTSPDTTAPTVSSSNRQTPSGASTNAASVTFRVTFSEPLNAATVSTADFSLIDVGGTITGESITAVAQGANSSIWDVTVNAGSGAGTLRLDVLSGTASLKDLNGLALTAGYTAGQTYTFDRTAPTVSSIVRTGSSPINATSVQYTVTFSESVTGLATTNFGLTTTGITGASVSSVSGSGANYTVTINTGTGSGTVRLNLNNSTGLADAAGNAVSNVPYTAGATYTIDKLAPTVSSINRVNATPTNATSVQYTVTFSETVSGLMAANFSLNASGLSGAGVGAITGTGPYTVTVNTGTGNGTLRLDLANSTGLADAAGNAVSNVPYTSGQSYTVDNTTPVATVTGPASPTRTSPISFTINFSESVTGLTATAADFAITNGTLGSLSGTGSGPYTLTVTPAGQGAVTCQVKSGAAGDSVGNVNAASNILSVVYDSIAPTVASIVRAGSTPTNTANVVFTVTFSEAISAATAANFTLNTTGLTGTAISNVSGAGTSYSVTVNTGSGNGTIRLDLANATGLADAAGNGVSNAPYTGGQTYTIDIIAPTATLSSTVGAQTKVAFGVSVVFSESVSGFTAGDISVSNGSVSGFTSTDASHYSWTVTPTGQGPVDVQVPASAGSDAAGNGSLASNVISTSYDSIAPTVDQKTPDQGAIINAVPNVSLHFSEVISGVTAGALTVNGSAATSVSGSGDGPYVFSGFAAPADGTINFALNGAAILDSATNAVGTVNWSATKNSVAVTAVLASAGISDGEATNANPVHYTATFAVAVSGLTAGDFAVSNGSLTNFSGSAASYAFDVIPSGQGTVSVQLPAGKCTGTAPPHNSNAASNTYSFIYDTIAPTVSLAANTSASTNAAFNVAVQFSEPTVNFVVGDVNAVNASITNFTGSGTDYSFTVNPTAQGTVSVQIGAGAATDAAGNSNTAGNLISLTYDTVAPTVVLSSTTSDSTNVSPISFRATFDEDVNGFIAADLIVTNGSLADFVPISGAVYDFTIAPAGNNLTVTIDLGAGAAYDAAGNASLAASTAISRVYDVVPAIPTVSGPASPSNGNPIVFTIAFDEAVTGLGTTMISVTGGTADSLTGSGSGPYSLSVTPTDQGIITCQVQAAAAQDAAGNPCVASNPASIEFDSAGPSATVSGPAASSRSNPLEFSITFGEAVSGLTTSGITVGNGTLGSLSGSGAGPYILQVTPAGEGVVTCAVGAGAASDSAGNGNLASNTASVVYDSVAPAISSIDRLTPAQANTNAATLTFRVTFNEPMDATTIEAGDFTPVLVSGALSGLVVTGVNGVDATTYDVSVNPGFGTGVVRLDAVLPVASFADPAGNVTAGSFTTGQIYAEDTDAPGVTINSTVGSQTNAAFSVTATFTEDVADFGYTAISVTNGTSGDLTGTGAGPYTWTVTPTGQGPVTVQIPSGACGDAAGNLNTLSNAINTNYDSVVPAIDQITPNDQTTINALGSVAIHFNEEVSGVSAGLLTVNGSPATVVTHEANGPYVFGGYSDPADGTVLVAFDGTTVIDPAANAVGATSWSYTKNSSAISIILSSAGVTNGGATNQNLIPFNVSFSQSVDGFTTAGLTIAGGTLQNFTGSAADYTFEVVPSGEGAIAIDIAAGVCTGTAVPHNPNAASNQFSFAFDTTTPTLTLTPASTGVVNGPFQVTALFSEPILGFTSADIELSSATITNFTGSGASYSFTVNPTVAQGAVVLGVPALAAVDTAGNSSAASNVLGLDCDSVAPTVTAVSVANGHTVAVTFSEAVGSAALNPASYSVAGTGRGALMVNPDSVSMINPNEYQLVWNGGEMRQDGDITITVSGVSDAAANLIGSPNSGTAVGGGIGIKPRITFSPIIPVLRQTTVGVVVFSFTEDVTGFDLADVTLTRNGTPVSLAALTLTINSASSYSVDLTTVTGTNGDYVLSVSASGNGIMDAAGNGLSGGMTANWKKRLSVNAVERGWECYQ